MSRIDRLFLFLYGRRNLVGTSLALLGLLLFFTGIIRHYWLFIVAGLYALGFLLTPAERRESLTPQGLDVDRIEDALDHLVRAIRQRVPAEVLAKVEGIREAIIALLPELQRQDWEQGHQIHIIRETALSYLPDMLGSYLRLPAAFAQRHPIKDGKTARQLLNEQLDLLDGEIKRIAVDLHRRDLGALVAHGRFLREKFGRSEWDLG
ncbi:hypothetical protein [Candidatus Methylocalor cossyra]|uniref:5-bromo-4-chloroindolyl phosphate hydrolysis protein n=1 Tax=Candidatus Methylocalor cossyra TaxID=3108543 RepID=A0ABM9NIN9_9GAMM